MNCMLDMWMAHSKRRSLVCWVIWGQKVIYLRPWTPDFLLQNCENNIDLWILSVWKHRNRIHFSVKKSQSLPVWFVLPVRMPLCIAILKHLFYPLLHISSHNCCYIHVINAFHISIQVLNIFKENNFSQEVNTVPYFL